MPASRVLDEAAALAPLLADAAGTICRRHFRRRIAVDDKADATPVTIADRDAEAALRTLIAGRFPEHGIIGEEHGSDRPDAEFVWTLDPIDGTGQFISGVPLFGTLVALLHEGRPVLGMIDQPVLRETWLGVEGRPTTLNGAAVSTRPCAALGDATLFATTPDMFEGGNVARFAALRRAVKRTRFGLDCYAYGLVASGFIDVVAESNMKLWDYAALVPVIEGAGGVVTGWQGERLGLASDGRILACGDRRGHAAALAVLAG
ncbi:MAG TPA: histidinol-phosphatase [Stellaceae bacterium]|nr:histidinol-phosphatase [Stellaceae bacterium]